MKASELRKKTSKELNTEIQELLKEQFNLWTQRGVGQVTQTHQFKLIRRNLARIKTILNEKAEGSAL